MRKLNPFNFNNFFKKEKYIPYGRQHVTRGDIKEVINILRSDFLTQGPAINSFEEAISKYLNCKYSISVNSGTSGLHIACKALGLRKGDLLWTSPTTFVASANCAKYCGAEVDFVDIDIDTGLISTIKLEEKLKLAEKSGRLPKIVIPVHLGGASCDMKKIFSLSKKYNFKIIEDASHALGGKFFNQLIGNCTYSQITVFSFHPVKMITTGEGGMITTNDPKLAKSLYQLRSHGITKDPNFFERESPGLWSYEQQLLGYNYRMTDIQAALGKSQLRRIDQIVKKRRKILQIYQDELSNQPILFLKEQENVKSSVHLVIVRLKDFKKSQHKKFFELLRSESIGVQLHYMPVHLQPFYRKLGFHEGQFPNSEMYAESALSLPVYPNLQNKDLYKVINKFKCSLKKLNND